jgi:hypothetical protein
MQVHIYKEILYAYARTHTQKKLNIHSNTQVEKEPHVCTQRQLAGHQFAWTKLNRYVEYLESQLIVILVFLNDVQ